MSSINVMFLFAHLLLCLHPPAGFSQSRPAGLSGRCYISAVPVISLCLRSDCLRRLPCDGRPPAPESNRCDCTPGPILAVIKNTQCLGACDPGFVSVRRQASLRGLGTKVHLSQVPFFWQPLWWQGSLTAGAEDLKGWRAVLYKYFHLISLSSWPRRRHAETIWRGVNLASWVEQDIFAAVTFRNKAN